MKFDNVTNRLKNLLTPEMKKTISVDLVCQQVVSQMFDGISSSQIDDLAAEQAVSMVTKHPDFGVLGSRVVASNIQKSCPSTFSEAMRRLIDDGVVNIMLTEGLDDLIVPERDFSLDFFGLRTLQKAYLLRDKEGIVIETPQYMFLRVACGLWGPGNLERVKETYDQLSCGYFTHATPTLFNAGTPRPQLSSCFLLGMHDSIDGIYEAAKQCAQISKWSGGIGMHISGIRASGSHICGTNGKSSGLVPMLRTFNCLARHVNQGGKRKGSIAVYLEPWHADIEAFLEIRLNQGDEEARCRDLFSALWVPDIFMRRLSQNADWSLFCPNEAPGLTDVYGEEFEDLYERYEREGKARKTVSCHSLWLKIIKSQVETGVPYIGYKDAVNRKTNQKNVGIIKSSNLCHEIMQYSDTDETAVCNLASLAVNKFVVNGSFDFERMMETVKIMTRNLNRVIDINFYPTAQAERSNRRHRPIGIGIQGLADAFILMGLSFDSPEARKLNHDIFESIYYASVQESVQQAIDAGFYDENERKYIPGTYSTFEGSPMSQGIFQFDMWMAEGHGDPFPLRHDWDALRELVKKHGVRNSLLIAPMPTASTAQILGNNEAFEPYTSNIYRRTTLAGDFTVVNKHLVKELSDLGLWSTQLRDQLITADGSVQMLNIPQEIKDRYKTVWEISQRVIIDMAADRGRFICQSQSMNLFLSAPTVQAISSMHLHAWKSGLKTGMYYLRTKAASRAAVMTEKKTVVCTDEVCTICSA